MKLEIYADETYPDLFWAKSNNRKASYFGIGSIWLANKNRVSLKKKLRELKTVYHINSEFKWDNVSLAKLEFYKQVIDLFFLSDIRFRMLLVEANKFNHNLSDNDAELGYYKMYYQVLNNWLNFLDYDDVSVFLDERTDRDRQRLSVLKRILNQTQTARINEVQAIKSSESLILQMVDLMTGAVNYKMNGFNKLENGSEAKKLLIEHIESHLDDKGICATYATEKKFNIFLLRTGESHV